MRASLREDPNLHSGIRRFFFFLSLAYIFMRFSMVHEAVAALTKVNIRPAILLGVPTLLGLLLCGGVFRVWGNTIAKLWLGFGLWMVMLIPLSSWPGGSFDQAWFYCRIELPMLFVVAGFAMTWDETKMLVRTLILAGIASSLMCKLMLKTVSTGRFELDIEGTSISNSNDLATHLLMMLPFLLYALMSKDTPIIIRLLSLPAVGYSPYIILGSGSRGAFIALIVGGLFLLWRAPLTQKAIVILTVPAVVALFFSLPENTRSRLMNYSTQVTDASSAAEEAQGSAAIRSRLMRKAFEYTLQKPLFGVGPGMFPTYDDQVIRKERSVHGTWHNPHIVFLQVSSEMGIPGFLLFTIPLILSLKRMLQLNRESRQSPLFAEVQRISSLTSLSQVFLYTNLLFLPIAYKMLMPALCGLSILLFTTGQMEMNRLRALAAEQKPKPDGAPGRGPFATSPPQKRPSLPLPQPGAEIRQRYR